MFPLDCRFFFGYDIPQLHREELRTDAPDLLRRTIYKESISSAIENVSTWFSNPKSSRAHTTRWSLLTWRF
jgi:hypothetical protein